MRYPLTFVLLSTFCPAQGLEYHADVLLAFNAGTVSYPECTIHAASGVGHVIGKSTYGSSYSGFLWTPTGGMVPRYDMIDFNASLLAVSQERVLDLATNQQVGTIPPPDPLHTRLASFAITDGGLVVGWAREPVLNPQPWHYDPFVWDATNGTRSLPDPDMIDAVRANDSGLVIGHLVRPNSAIRQAYVHDLNTGGTVVLSSLMPPAPLQPYTRSEVFDVSAAGHVIGEGYSGTTSQGFVWTAASGFTWLPALNGGDVQRVHPRGVAADGTIVGRALDGNSDWRAFIWDPVQGMRDLNALTALPAGFVFDRAERIAEDGWIVGAGSGPGWTPPKGVILRPRLCQPDLGHGGPGSVALRVCGLPLASGNSTDVEIVGAPPNGLAALAFGFQQGFLPVYGGTLVPTPAASLLLITDAQGERRLPGLISGGHGPLSIYAQVVTFDPGQALGLGFSNAVRIDLLQ